MLFVVYNTEIRLFPISFKACFSRIRFFFCCVCVNTFRSVLDVSYFQLCKAVVQSPVFSHYYDYFCFIFFFQSNSSLQSHPCGLQLNSLWCIVSPHKRSENKPALGLREREKEQYYNKIDFRVVVMKMTCFALLFGFILVYAGYF